MAFKCSKPWANISFTLIFTTAYEKFAVQAFKYSAFDYLLKPIDDEELVAAVQKLKKKTRLLSKFSNCTKIYIRKENLISSQLHIPEALLLLNSRILLPSKLTVIIQIFMWQAAKRYWFPKPSASLMTYFRKVLCFSEHTSSLSST